jgi:LysM repeat protein
MKWKDTAEGEPVKDDEVEEDDYPEGAFSAIQEKRMGRMLQVALAVGAIAVVALLFLLVPKSDKGGGDEKLAALEAKVEQLNDNIKKFERIDERFAKIEESARRVEQFRERFDRLEAALTHRLDQIGERVESLPKKTAAVEPSAPAVSTAKPATAAVGKPVAAQAAKAAASATPAAKPAVAAVTQKGTRYHVVQPGETLFSIAKSAGLSVNELRRLNSLSPASAIQPGQKLVVGKQG